MTSGMAFSTLLTACCVLLYLCNTYSRGFQTKYLTAVFRAINALAAGGAAEEVPDYFIAMTTFSECLMHWLHGE